MSTGVLLKTRETQRHPAMSQFEYRDGEPLINDLSLWQVADIAGRTPFYVYDFAVVARRIEALRYILPPELQLHYAIKANRCRSSSSGSCRWSTAWTWQACASCT